MDGQRPAPFRMADKKEWIACDQPGLEGFAVLVRTSVTNAEQDELRERFRANAAYQEAYFAAPAPERDRDDTPRRRELALVAPYVLDWNAVGVGSDGDEKPLPPPAVAGPDAFECVTPDAERWIVQVVLLGYHATGKAGSWRAG
jgi:hypothetical protein